MGRDGNPRVSVRERDGEIEAAVPSRGQGRRGGCGRGHSVFQTEPKTGGRHCGFQQPQPPQPAYPPAPPLFSCFAHDWLLRKRSDVSDWKGRRSFPEHGGG